MTKQEELKMKLIQEQITFRESFKKGFKFFFDNSAHIEVIINKSLEKIDFIKLPFCKDMPKTLKNDFWDEVAIDSVKTKAKDLVEFGPKVTLTCRHEQK